MLEGMLGSEKEPVYGPAVKGDIRFSCADISKASDMLGYVPQHTFDEGIKVLAEWYKKNI